MIDGHEVRPSTWRDVIDLYDDGTYSAIWGTYIPTDKRRAIERRLGTRWNGDENNGNGYPSSRGQPVWYAENVPFEYVMIAEMLRRVKAHSEWGNAANLQRALMECEGGER